MVLRLMQVKAECQKIFPDYDFYVVFYPGSTKANQIISYLETQKIPSLDYSELFPDGDAAYIIHEEDKHPSALALKTLAKAMVEDLRLAEQIE